MDNGGSDSKICFFAELSPKRSPPCGDGDNYGTPERFIGMGLREKKSGGTRGEGAGIEADGTFVPKSPPVNKLEFEYPR